jgi:hypothetical protein
MRGWGQKRTNFYTNPPSTHAPIVSPLPCLELGFYFQMALTTMVFLFFDKPPFSEVPFSTAPKRGSSNGISEICRRLFVVDWVSYVRCMKWLLESASPACRWSAQLPIKTKNSGAEEKPGQEFSPNYRSASHWKNSLEFRRPVGPEQGYAC